MRCQHCNQENSNPGAFCTICGSCLDQVPAASVSPAVAADQFCSQCGAARDPQAAFCENCGAGFSALPTEPIPLQAQQPVNTAKTPKAPLSWPLLDGIAAFFLVLVGAGGALFLLPGQKPAEVSTQRLVDADKTAVAAQREAAFQQFTRAMESMEVFEQGKGNENTLVAALESAEQATVLDPSAAPYWHLLGYVYSQLQDDQLASVLAEDALNKALSINPGNLPSRLLLARLLIGRQAYTPALDQLEWVAKKDPKVLNSLLTADMCRAYVVDAQAARGEVFFREMLKQRPEVSALRLGLAIVLHEQGQKAAALSQIAELLASSQANPDDIEYARQLEKAWRGGRS